MLPKSLASLILLTGCSLLATLPSPLAQTRPAERIVSINMCTDQLLLDMANPKQIIGLSPFARHTTLSRYAAKAEGLPLLSGTSEEVMILKPDLVVADRYTKSATREFIRGRGIVMEEFEPATSIAETRRQIIRFGEITGAKQSASERIAAIDSAAQELKKNSTQSGLRVLQLSRRGWVSGSASLISELLATAGLANAADELGLRLGGFIGLEALVTLRPDAIVLTQDNGTSEDQGSALLLHPAIQKMFPPERRIILPDQLTICGGPMLAEAMHMLAVQITRIKPRNQK